MGRDLLVKCVASVLCGPDGLVVTFPNGYSVNCSMTMIQSMMLSADTSPLSEGQWADIYWGLLEPEGRQGAGIQSLYNKWKPWVQMLHPYAPPADPLHPTLYYDSEGNELYQHAFYQELEGTHWSISSSGIFYSERRHGCCC